MWILDSWNEGISIKYIAVKKNIQSLQITGFFQIHDLSPASHGNVENSECKIQEHLDLNTSGDVVCIANLPSTWPRRFHFVMTDGFFY